MNAVVVHGGTDQVNPDSPWIRGSAAKVAMQRREERRGEGDPDYLSPAWTQTLRIGQG